MIMEGMSQVKLAPKQALLNSLHSFLISAGVPHLSSAIVSYSVSVFPSAIEATG